MHFENTADLIAHAERFARHAADSEGKAVEFRRRLTHGKASERDVVAYEREAAHLREWEARLRRFAKAF